jgi:alginate O-acetyltransferase complex protein AlgI
MLLGGLWHGASWTFVAWGALHGSYLAFEHWQAQRRAARGIAVSDSRRSVFVQRLVTFQLVCLAWIFFRAATFDDALSLIGRLFTGWGEPSTLVKPSVLLAIGVGIGMQYVPRRSIGNLEAVFSRLQPLMMGLALGVVLLFIDALGPQGTSNFIYFAF